MHRSQLCIVARLRMSADESGRGLREPDALNIYTQSLPPGCTGGSTTWRLPCESRFLLDPNPLSARAAVLSWNGMSRHTVSTVMHFSMWMRQANRRLADVDETLVVEFLEGHLPQCTCATSARHPVDRSAASSSVSFVRNGTARSRCGSARRFRSHRPQRSVIVPVDSSPFVSEGLRWSDLRTRAKSDRSQGMSRAKTRPAAIHHELPQWANRPHPRARHQILMRSERVPS